MRGSTLSSVFVLIQETGGKQQRQAEEEDGVADGLGVFHGPAGAERL
jgi:hypothetical protein